MLLYEAYAGALWRPKHYRAWMVRFTQKHKVLLTETFKYEDNKDEMYEAASEFRRKTSDMLGLTTRVYANTTTTDKQKAFYAGFIDGDGCIHLSTNGRPIISLKQAQTTKVPELIQHLQISYGGSIYMEEGIKGGRRKYGWVLTGHKTLPLLYDMVQFATLKAPQAKLLLDHILATQSLDCRHLHQKLKAMKQLSTYQATPIDTTRLNSSYLAGFFCAEGTVSIYNRKIRVVFAQNSSPLLLTAINEFYNMQGHVDKKDVRFNETKGVAVLRDMLPYMIGPKKPQAILALEASSYKAQNVRKRRNPYTERLLEIETEVKRLKHT